MAARHCLLLAALGRAASAGGERCPAEWGAACEDDEHLGLLQARAAGAEARSEANSTIVACTNAVVRTLSGDENNGRFPCQCGGDPFHSVTCSGESTDNTCYTGSYVLLTTGKEGICGPPACSRTDGLDKSDYFPCLCGSATSSETCSGDGAHNTCYTGDAVLRATSRQGSCGPPPCSSTDGRLRSDSFPCQCGPAGSAVVCDGGASSDTCTSSPSTLASACGPAP